MPALAPALKDAYERVSHHLHREAPVHALCFYRAAFGLILLLEALAWLPHTTELFSSEGFHVPQLAGMPAPPPGLAFVITLLLCVCAALLTAGLFTRAAAALTLFFWLYLWTLDSLTEKAAHTLAAVVLTVLFFSPCMYRFSLDRVLRRRRGQADFPESASMFCQRLLQLQFAQMYFFCGVSKMINPDWVNGNVTYRVMNGRLATPFGVLLSRLDSYFFARAAGLGTILFELFEGFLLFLPYSRPIAMAAALGFHLGIQSTLYVGSLGAHFMLAVLVLFPRPESSRAWIERGLSRFLPAALARRA